MHKALAFALLAAVAGCSSKDMEGRRNVTRAALATYPGDARESRDVQVAAVDRPKDKRLELLNLTDRTITSPTVWVNQTYLSKAESIPPRGYVVVRYADLIESGRGVQDLTSAGTAVNKVEIQTADGLYTVLGPSRR